MIRLDVVQGSHEWEQARIGIPTASCFDRILTPKKMQLSAEAPKYRNEIIAEWLLGYALDFGGAGAFADRGTNMEAEARRYYEMRHDVDVELVGFVLRDDGAVGGSPDGLVGEDGGVDFKCPAIHTHIGYMIAPQSLAEKYRGQAQGYMYLTERSWWDVQSYNPILPAVTVRLDRDDKYIGALDAALTMFVAELDELKEQLEEHKQTPITYEIASA